MSPDMEYIVDQAKAVLAIDSPTSYTKAAASYVLEEYRRLGFRPEMTAKGGVLVCLNPEAPEEDSLLLMAHLDTLGAMVAEIGGDGRLRLTNLGGMNPNNAEAENVRVVTRSGKVYTGTCQLKNASSTSTEITPPPSVPGTRWKLCWMKRHIPSRTWKRWAS